MSGVRFKGISGTRSNERRNRRPRLELLEPRTLLTTIVVTGTGDTIATDGVVTLREAITAANSDAASGDAAAGSAGLDTIEFDIPGAGVHVIDLENSLPAITEPVVIDGYSQPDATPNTSSIDQPDNAVPLIQLDGSNGIYNTGLVINGDGSTIKGLIITGFFTTLVGGISIGPNAAGNHIEGNFIGTTPQGVNGGGNYFGVDVQGHDNIIGGTDPADRNLISANQVSAVDVHGSGATNNLIEGNFLGPKANGTTKFPLGQDGVLVDSASNTTIGGTTPSARNVITNAAPGIDIFKSSGTVVLGNYIGVDRTGVAAVPNTTGIVMSGATDTQIGGTDSGAGNVI